MSKKKNTLQDLDEFLKQQAATLVEPTPLREAIEESPVIQNTIVPTTEISESSILDTLKTLATREGTNFSTTLSHLIIQSLGSQKNTSAQDKMLINTALYLTNGANWKEAIKNYWEKH
ncbi:MAG: hypothetical protein ABIS36_25555 [Chryseolinea sp.]